MQSAALERAVWFCCSVRRLLERGFVKRWQQLYWPKPLDCEGGGRGALQLNLSDVQGVFLVLFVALIGGSLVFFTELLLCHCVAIRDYFLPDAVRDALMPPAVKDALEAERRAKLELANVHAVS